MIRSKWSRAFLNTGMQQRRSKGKIKRTKKGIYALDGLLGPGLMFINYNWVIEKRQQQRDSKRKIKHTKKGKGALDG
jgi:hypothetical protein